MTTETRDKWLTYLTQYEERQEAKYKLLEKRIENMEEKLNNLSSQHLVEVEKTNGMRDELSSLADTIRATKETVMMPRPGTCYSRQQYIREVNDGSALSKLSSDIMAEYDILSKNQTREENPISDFENHQELSPERPKPVAYFDFETTSKRREISNNRTHGVKVVRPHTAGNSRGIAKEDSSHEDTNTQESYRKSALTDRIYNLAYNTQRPVSEKANERRILSIANLSFGDPVQVT